MKKIIVFLLSLTIVFTPTLLWAGAAEKWDYDVIPDQSQTLKIKGHKVDQYGAAVNDYDYNTKIDPKTAANRTKMGNVGIGRLLKISGWGLLGSAALQSLLEAVDWVIDPATQSIWRNKTDSSSSCSYTRINGFGQKLIKLFNSDGLDTYCPYDSALHRLKERSKYPGYAGSKLDFVKWDPVLTPTTTNFRFEFKVTVVESGYTSYEYLDVPYTEVPYNPPSEKEYLTPEQLADYANHTHSDYANPELAPKLEPKYSPEIQTDLWKPSNPWEDANSPTVDEVKKELERAKPEPKDDKIKENEPDPDTGVKSFSLPAFCSWATVICEFIDWSKKEPENSEKDDTQIESPTPFDNSVFTKDRFKVSRQCPVPEQHQISLSGITTSFTFDLKPICSVFELARPALIACSYLYACYIVIGAARNG